MKKVTIYTDGSCSGNPGPGGYCAILRYGEKEKIVKGSVSEDTTNNRMELTAVIEGLKVLKTSCSVEIFSDSRYVVDAINGWVKSCTRKDLSLRPNGDLWSEYLRLSAPHQISAKWVKGHDGHPENERCDAIAREMTEAAKNRPRRIPDETEDAAGRRVTVTVRIKEEYRDLLENLYLRARMRGEKIAKGEILEKALERLRERTGNS